MVARCQTVLDSAISLATNKALAEKNDIPQPRGLGATCLRVTADLCSFYRTINLSKKSSFLDVFFVFIISLFKVATPLPKDRVHKIYFHAMEPRYTGEQEYDYGMEQAGFLAKSRLVADVRKDFNIMNKTGRQQLQWENLMVRLPVSISFMTCLPSGCACLLIQNFKLRRYAISKANTMYLIGSRSEMSLGNPFSGQTTASSKRE